MTHIVLPDNIFHKKDTQTPSTPTPKKRLKATYKSHVLLQRYRWLLIQLKMKFGGKFSLIVSLALWGPPS